MIGWRSKQGKLLCNLIVVLILALAVFGYTELGKGRLYSPEQAIRQGEEQLFYGPSQIVLLRKMKMPASGDSNGKEKETAWFLSRYDKWYSFGGAKKDGLFRWMPGNRVYGLEIETEKPVNWSWLGQYDTTLVFGLVDDTQIQTIDMIYETGDQGKQGEIVQFTGVPVENGGFICSFDHAGKSFKIQSIIARDENGIEVYTDAV